MLQAVWDQLQPLLGLGRNIGDVSAAQMALRTIVVFVFTLAIVRVGSKRFLGKETVFDVIVGMMLGSIMSRAINSSAPFFPSLLGGGVLLGMHWLFAVLTFRFGWFGPLVKGNPVLLINKDGDIQRQEMRRESLTANDLAEALRLQAKQTDPSKVRLAYLERNGNISVIPRQHEPRVFDVPVEDGVQTVRIELE